MECKAPYGYKCNQECQYCDHPKPAAASAGSSAIGPREGDKDSRRTGLGVNCAKEE